MKRHGGSLLVIGALVLLGGTGGFIYWVTHRDHKSSLLVFHWVPGPGPLKILGAPPFYTAGQDIADTLDPRLLELLHERAVGGELRLITEFVPSRRLKAGACALLLQNPPTGSLTMSLLDRRAALYVDRGSGLVIFPEQSAVSGATIVLKHDASMGFFRFSTNDGRGSGTDNGIVVASWW
jgi:hypothetical protein